jgi:hypothetical protein
MARLMVAFVRARQSKSLGESRGGWGHLRATSGAIRRILRAFGAIGRVRCWASRSMRLIEVDRAPRNHFLPRY